jgi:hypothetical protein
MQMHNLMALLHPKLQKMMGSTARLLEFKFECIVVAFCVEEVHEAKVFVVPGPVLAHVQVLLGHKVLQDTSQYCCVLWLH